MNKALLIDTNYIKTATGLDINISDNLLKKSIVKCQKDFILQALGTALYDQLCSQTLVQSFSANNITLMQEHVQPTLCSYVLWDTAEWLYYKFTAKSIELQTSNNSQPISEKGLDRIKEKLLDTAQGDMNRLVLYLQSNTDIFPLYVNAGSDIDTVHPNVESPFHGGIFTEGAASRSITPPDSNNFRIIY